MWFLVVAEYLPSPPRGPGLYMNVEAEYLPSPPGGPSLYMNVEALGFFGDLWFLGLGLAP